MFQGGGGYGGGGGYSQGMGGGFTGGGFTSPGGDGDKTKKFSRSQNLVPLTTAHIRALTNDGNSFHLGETEIGQVTLVGIVTHVEKSTTSVTYNIDDTTSEPIALKHWYLMETGEDGEGGGEEETIYNEGTYIRVYAHIRSFQNKISLSSLKIQPVEDMNELSVHILECLKFQMSINRKGKMEKMESSSGGGFSSNQPGMSSNVTNMGIDKIQSQVFELIKGCDEEEGLSFNDIKSNLRGLNTNQIKNSLEFLSNEGHIYTTIDDDHFKITG